MRNKIYEEALGGLDGVHICNGRQGLRRSCAGTTDVGSGAKPAASLLATCRAVHDEAAEMLYGQRFRFADNRALLTFLTLLRPATAARLRAAKMPISFLYPAPAISTFYSQPPWREEIGSPDIRASRTRGKGRRSASLRHATCNPDLHVQPTNPAVLYK